MAQRPEFAEAVREAIGELSISQVAYKTGVSYEYVRTMVTYGRIPSEVVLHRFAEGLGADLPTLRIAAGYDQPSDPVERVKTALNSLPGPLEDYQVDRIRDLLEKYKKQDAED